MTLFFFFLNHRKIAFFKILSNLKFVSFRYDTYLQYHLNITQKKVREKTFEIVYIVLVTKCYQ